MLSPAGPSSVPYCLTKFSVWPYAKGGAEVVDLSPNSSSRWAHLNCAELLPPPPYFLKHKCERTGLS